MPVLPMMGFQNIQPQGIPALRNLFSNLQQGIQTSFLPSELNEDVLSKHLANQLKTIQNQYAPQLTEAELAKHLADVNLANQQAQYYGPNINSEIALRDAQRQLFGGRAELLPFEAAAKLDPITSMIAGRQLAGKLTEGSLGNLGNISTNDSGMTINTGGNNTPNVSRIPVRTLPGGLTESQASNLLNGVNNVPENTPNVVNSGVNLKDLYNDLYNTQFQNAILSMGKSSAFGGKQGAGGTYINPMTGEVISTPTSSNTTQDQATISAINRVTPLLDELGENVAPFSTIGGQAHLRYQQLMNYLTGGNNPLPAQYAKGKEILKLAPESLIRAWGLKPTNYVMKTMEKAVEPVHGESGDQYKSRLLWTLQHLGQNAEQAGERLRYGQSLPTRGSQSSTKVANTYNPSTGNFE